MAFGIVHKFPGATKEQYEASVKAVHPEGGDALSRSLPARRAFTS
jgi:hypothetical protein